MPLDQVNLLNPGNELSRRASGSKWGKLSDSLLQIGGDPGFDDGQTKFIEIGCKVHEIN